MTWQALSVRSYLGDEKEKLGDIEGDDLTTDVRKLFEYYRRTMDPRWSRYWPSHCRLRRAVKQAGTHG